MQIPKIYAISRLSNYGKNYSPDFNSCEFTVTYPQDVLKSAVDLYGLLSLSYYDHDLDVTIDQYIGIVNLSPRNNTSQKPNVVIDSGVDSRCHSVVVNKQNGIVNLDSCLMNSWSYSYSYPSIDVSDCSVDKSNNCVIYMHNHDWIYSDAAVDGSFINKDHGNYVYYNMETSANKELITINHFHVII